MNESDEHDEIADGAEVDLAKRQEKAGFKKILLKLALSVIGVTVAVQVAAFFAYSLLASYSQDFALSTTEQFAIILEARGVTGSVQSIAYLLTWLLNSLIVYAPPLVIFALVFRKHTGYQRLGTPYEYKMFWVFPLFLAGLVLSIASSIVTHLIADLFTSVFGGDGLPDVFADVQPQSSDEFLIMFVVVGVVAPVLEEIIYRHLLLRPLRRYGDMQAVIITALLFGFFHSNLTQFLYSAVAGLLFGIVAVRANSVIPAIIMHMLNNVYVVVFGRLADLSESGQISLGMDALTMIQLTLFALGLVSLVVMAVKGRLHIDNHNALLSTGERTKAVLLSPAIIVMFSLQVLVTILGTMAFM